MVVYFGSNHWLLSCFLQGNALNLSCNSCSAILFYKIPTLSFLMPSFVMVPISLLAPLISKRRSFTSLIHLDTKMKQQLLEILRRLILVHCFFLLLCCVGNMDKTNARFWRTHRERRQNKERRPAGSVNKQELRGPLEEPLRWWATGSLIPTRVSFTCFLVISLCIHNVRKDISLNADYINRIRLCEHDIQDKLEQKEMGCIWF